MHPTFNACDFLILAVLGFSSLLGYWRGFVRELLGLVAWVAALWLGAKHHIWAQDLLGRWLQDPTLVRWGAMALAFCLWLAFFLTLAQVLSRISHDSAISGANHVLGLIFGLLRGGVVVCGFYMASLIVINPSAQPPILRTSYSIAALDRVAIALYPYVAPYFPEKSPLYAHIQALKGGLVWSLAQDASKPLDTLSLPLKNNGDMPSGTVSS